MVRDRFWVWRLWGAPGTDAQSVATKREAVRALAGRRGVVALFRRVRPAQPHVVTVWICESGKLFLP